MLAISRLSVPGYSGYSFSVQRTRPVYPVQPRRDCNRVGFSGAGRAKTALGLLLGVFMGLGALTGIITKTQQAPSPIGSSDRNFPVKPRRNVYFLHSGMGDLQDLAANELKAWLIREGENADNVFIIDNIYPEMQWEDLNPFSSRSGNIAIYRDSADPQSNVSKAVRSKVSALMKEKGIGPEDNLIWIGHSAGGQMGLTLCADTPKSSGIPFRRVVCLGAPIISNLAPKQTEVYAYVSKGDHVLTYTTEFNYSFILGKRTHRIPPNLDDNDAVRDIPDIGHMEWFTRPESLTQLKRDLGLASWFVHPHSANSHRQASK